VAAEGLSWLLRHAGGFVITGWILACAPVALSAPLEPAAVSAADGTPPIIAPSVQGTVGLNGWYRSNVTVAWSVTDPESGIVETSGCDTRTFTADTPGTSVTCSATNGADLSGSYTFTAKLDKTAPEVTGATPARGPDANGWYNRGVAFGFSGSDAMSGIDACPSVTYSGPDSGTASVTGTCRDKAGNTAASAFGLKYDATAPSVTGTTPDRAPDVNGWYNRAVDFRFSGSDATSTIDVCPTVTYSGPDGGPAAVRGTCRDMAGNVGSRDFALQYDSTRPVVTGASAARGPDVNGWYNNPVAFTFAGSDATSGIDACPAVTYSSPDSETASVTGTCRDWAGNTATRGFPLKYDATKPTVTGMAPTRPADSNGWYNRSVPFTLTGADATSGIDACPAVTYSGPDSETASVTGTCRDWAGNIATRSHSLKYDATAPVVGASPDRAPNAAGWYNRAVLVSFSATDAVSRVESCVQPVTYSGPDSGGASVDGTCRDFAGNVGSRSFALKYDATDPTVTGASAGRSADANGWYNRPVAFSFTGTDAMAGIDACPAVTYEGPDADAASVIGVCRDRAGNTASRGFPLKYDATNPTVTGMAPDRSPDANGWYNHAVAFSLTGADQTSGLDSCSAPRYEGPDSNAASVTGTCRDRAGNTAPRGFSLKYDATAPAVTGTNPGRAPDANGWYNHAVTFGFSGSDAISGLDVCPTATYSGPDGDPVTVTGSCRDVAGNVGSRSFALKYDATNPTVTGATAGRSADANGWYNHPVAFSFTGSDATAGIEACPAVTYEGPDGDAASVTGVCRDRAGNTATRGFPLKYDATRPVVRATPDRPPNGNGWYNRAVVVSFDGSDPASGIDTCAQPVEYAGPDGEAASVTGTCRDLAGNVGPGTLPLKYDATAPMVTSTPAGRGPDSNGWYNHAVTFSFAGSDVTSGIASCDAPTYAGPDSASASVTGVCRDRAGNASAPGSAEFRYDSTDPTVTGILPERPPDANGWYNHPVSFSLTGTDAMSGFDGCTSGRYEGPDRRGAPAPGVCRDKAGNEATATRSLDYDETPPTVEAVAARAPDRYGWYSRPIRFDFVGGDATSGIASCSDPILYRAPNSARASVTGACADLAGNRAGAATTFRYAQPLLLPRPGARVSGPPLLDWVEVPSARRYNVQVWHGGRKILSVWPTATSFKLRWSWRFEGRRHRLEPGLYRVHVWPRIGNRYGFELARTSFLVRA
jgi:hypothetical protein